MKYPETRKALVKFKDQVVENAQRELGTTRVIKGKKVRRVNTDDLRKSLFGVVKFRKQGFQINFSSKMDYASFIHEGVNGTKVKNNAPYSFKGKYVNIGAIEKYVRGRKFKIRKDGRFVAKTEKNVKSTAFVVARSIAERGIVGLPYFSLGLETASKKDLDKIADSFALDAINILE